MASLSKFSGIRAKYADLVDFVTVYIEEAHPSEKNHFTGNFDITTHNTFKDRLEAAGVLREEAGDLLKGCPILVDRIDDAANKAYAALPERLYVVLDQTIVYEGGIGPFDYKLDEVESFLQKSASKN